MYEGTMRREERLREIDRESTKETKNRRKRKRWMDGRGRWTTTTIYNVKME
jgi:hypothetical protein